MRPISGRLRSRPAVTAELCPALNPVCEEVAPAKAVKSIFRCAVGAACGWASCVEARKVVRRENGLGVRIAFRRGVIVRVSLTV